MENRKFLTKGKILIASILLFIFLPTTMLGVLSLREGEQWLYFHSGSLTGRLVDTDTNAPVEGALVIAQWRTWPIMAGPHPIMFLFWLNPLNWMGYGLTNTLGSGKVIVAATDKDGRYEIPSWWLFQPWTYNEVGSSKPKMCIYKPGYKTLYTDLGRWMMNDKEISVDTNNIPLIKLLTAKEIIDDYMKYYRGHGCLYSSSTMQDWLKAQALVEKALVNVPPDARKKIEKDLKD
jgi:hypothetical protein